MPQHTPAPTQSQAPATQQAPKEAASAAGARAPDSRQAFQRYVKSLGGPEGGADTKPVHQALGPATRAGFVCRLLPIETAILRDPIEVMNIAHTRGLVSERGEAARPADPVTRAEAAVMLTRFARLTGVEPGERVLYFADVFPGAWFFQAAHACRLYGIFSGTTENRFEPHDDLAPEHVALVILRALSPRLTTTEEQRKAAGLTVSASTRPSDLDALLAQERLTHEQVARAREMIAQLPEKERPDKYRQLAAKVRYRNQRDNEGVKAAKDAKAYGYPEAGDVMCNVTSMAMALNQLGLGADEGDKQLEDQLDEQMIGSRYEQGGQANAAGQHGADVARVSTPAFRNGDAAREWFQKSVAPRLEAGASATMGIYWGPERSYAHIVRLEWVEADGVRVDDPYGSLYKNPKGTYVYDKNDPQNEVDAGAKGEDGLWSWDTVAGVMPSGRYVQFYTVK